MLDSDQAVQQLRLPSNILVFDQERAKLQIAKVIYEDEGKGKKRPVYRFYDGD